MVLAALLRLLVTADGHLGEREGDATEEVARRLGLSVDAWRAVWDRASRELAGAEAVRQAALDLRPAIRDAVYELLYRVAESDGIADREWDLLEWLDERWLSTCPR